MASLLSYIPVVNQLVGGGGRHRSIAIPPVPVYNVESGALADKRSRTLKHLLRANHVNHSVIYHNLQYDNHLPHILSSAYILGANENQLQRIYDVEARELEPWEPSPAEITRDDWQDFLGDKRYQRAYVDFFEDRLAMDHGYDWSKVIHRYMFEGEKPLVNGLVGGRESLFLSSWPYLIPID